MDRRRAAWVGLGLMLDWVVLLAALGAMRPAVGVKFQLIDGLLRSIGVGVLLTLVHLVLLPGLVWPSRRLGFGDAAWAVGAAFTLVLELVLAVEVVLPVFVLVVSAASSAEPLRGLAIPIAIVALHAIAGAFTFATVAGVSKLPEGWVRPGYVLVGGAVAGVVLGGLVVSEWWQWRRGEFRGMPQFVAAWSVCLLAGLPHLLLSAWRLDLDTMASLPVAARRAGVVLVVLVAAGLAFRLGWQA